MSDHVVMPRSAEAVGLPAEADAAGGAVRRALVKRIMDVVALPASRAGLQDRAIAGDLLLEMLVDADIATRELCARRMKEMSQAPKRLLRYLALDVPQVSQALLGENKAFDESDFAHIVQHGQSFHRKLVASRREAGPAVATAIAESEDVEAIRQLLANPFARLSDRCVDLVVNMSRVERDLVPLLIEREELRPAHALAMFWWAAERERRTILLRFSAERMLLIDACSDIFRIAGEEAVSDPLLRKALQVIERRQRSRAAAERSAFGSLEDAVKFARSRGIDPALAGEISHMCGVRPQTGARIFADPGGEGVAVMCKATGLKRPFLQDLWIALHGDDPAALARYDTVREIYDSIAVAKAQTVLRYWNWSFSSAYVPDVMGTDDAARASG
ncbi:DUF2336 domain-containing protein [bacterium]|nr:DUF2336 domain-containing protein [bacterium]